MAEARGAASLVLRRLRDVVRRSPVTCGADTSAQEVARRLQREGVGSVLVLDDEGAPIGIVTDRDLRAKVVAEARQAASTPARDIMSSPLVTLSPAAFAVDALLEMTRHRIRHIVLLESGRAVGVVSATDFVTLQTAHPVVLAREISRAPSVDALAELSPRVTALVSRLVAEGSSPYDIGQIVAELSDWIVTRVLALVAAELESAGAGAPPAPYCWLVFGSEARREQTLRTDQDNGLVYADPPEERRGAAGAYYARFAQDVIRALIAVGFTACPGNVMASNPRWCQPLSVWQGYFSTWIDHPSPRELLDASIYFDLRPVAGATDQAARLRAIIAAQAPKSHVFLGLLALEVVSRRLPLTLFGRVTTPRSGPYRGRLDVKAAGTFQLVGAGRVAALELGRPELNTIDRFQAAAEAGLYTAAEAQEIGDAYRHLMRLRLVHQLAQLAAGATPDNRIDVAALSRADALLLRDGLKTVDRVQAGLRARFSTDRLG